MRVVVLGAAGAVGAEAASTVASFPEVTELVLADRDAADAERIAAPLGDRARSASVDVRDPASTRELLAGADAVLNATGPFFSLGVGVLVAALETRTTYLDVNDDPEPTLEMLALHPRAVERGVAAVVGMGASPGVANLMAREAAGSLDAVRDVLTVWPVDVPLPGQEALLEDGELDGASAALRHWMQQISGSITVQEHGGLVPVRPLAPVRLAYPGRAGGTVYTVGHPEAVTLGPRLGASGRAITAMAVTGATVAFLDGLRTDIDAGRLSLEAAAAQVGEAGAGRKLRAAMRAFRFPGPGDLPAFFALVSGERDGAMAQAGATVRSFPAGMARATGIPLALALRQVLRRPPAPGVWAPEDVLDPRELLAALGPYCDPPLAAGQELLELTTSPLTDTRKGAPR